MLFPLNDEMNFSLGNDFDSPPIAGSCDMRSRLFGCHVDGKCDCESDLFAALACHVEDSVWLAVPEWRVANEPYHMARAMSIIISGQLTT